MDRRKPAEGMPARLELSPAKMAEKEEAEESRREEDEGQLNIEEIGSSESDDSA